MKIFMSICTGRGKDGVTDLLFGKRLDKADQRFEVMGSLDELNAHIGVVRCGNVSESIKEILSKLQGLLVSLMGELATLPENQDQYDEKGYSRLTEEDRQWVLALIKEGESGENPIKFRGWAMPGAAGQQDAAHMDVCRTICRRAERQFWKWDTEAQHTLSLIHI